MTTTYAQARIEADATVPMIHIWRDFHATPAQLFRAHTDPEVFARWVGPADIGADIDYWDARDGGSWRYTAGRDMSAARRYSPKEKFAPGDVVNHPSFGVGVAVVLKDATKIEVIFPEGSKVLVHGRT